MDLSSCVLTHSTEHVIFFLYDILYERTTPELEMYSDGLSLEFHQKKKLKQIQNYIIE